MPVTLIDKSKGKLYNSVVKVKRMTKMTNAKAIILPSGWIKSLGWDMNTHIAMTLDPYNDRIIIYTHEKNNKLETSNDRVYTDSSEEVC